MASSIQRLALPCLPALGSSFFSGLQEKTSQLFFKAREALYSVEQQPAQHRAVIDLGAIGRDPSQLIEGSIWGLWWAAGVYFLTGSMKALYSAITVEDSGSIKFEKICAAVKAVFEDALSLAGSTSYAIRWADSASIIALGRYLPLVQHLCYGTSLALHLSELVFEGREFCIGATKLSREQSPFLFQQSFQRMAYLSMKLISNISMVAWAALGIAGLAGVSMHSVLMPLLLAVGCVVGVAAIGYRMKANVTLKI